MVLSWSLPTIIRILDGVYIHTNMKILFCLFLFTRSARFRCRQPKRFDGVGLKGSSEWGQLNKMKVLVPCSHFYLFHFRLSLCDRITNAKNVLLLRIRFDQLILLFLCNMYTHIYVIYKEKQQET